MTAALATMSGTRWVGADTAALVLSWMSGRLVKAQTIRQWAFRKHITTSTDRRREPYDLDEVITYARSRGLIRSQNNSEQGGQ